MATPYITPEAEIFSEDLDIICSSACTTDPDDQNGTEIKA